MSSIVEIKPDKRRILYPLFQSNKYDTVLINSVLEGHFGTAYADSDSQPSVARLDSGAFTLLGGDSESPQVLELLSLAPIHYVTPESKKWRELLKEFGDHITRLTFTEFHATSLNIQHLKEIIGLLPQGFILKRVDIEIAQCLTTELNNEYFFENFHSIDDFITCGIGYCILYQERVVSAATSMAMCNDAIDIEIETSTDFRGKSLGSFVGAKLVLYCLENNIEPKWLAANEISEQLALKLGYTKGKKYETYKINH
ncbi:MAG: GNAT family N-acetyltransferase [Candidatus Methanofastidiosia archaeon]